MTTELDRTLDDLVYRHESHKKDEWCCLREPSVRKTLQELLIAATLKQDIKYHTLKAKYERVFLGGEEKAKITKQHVKKLKRKLEALSSNKGETND